MLHIYLTGGISEESTTAEQLILESTLGLFGML